MKIVHLSDYYQSQIGYQEPNLAQAHRDLGHEVHVITADRYFPFPEYKKNFEHILGPRIQKPGVFEEEGVTVHRLPCYFEYSPSAFIFLRGISKTLKAIKPDVVFSHDIHNLSAYFSAVNQKKLGYQLVYDNHAAKFNTNLYDSFLKRSYLMFWRIFIKPQILKKSKRVVAIGKEEQALAADLLALSQDEIDIIPLGADTKLFSPNQEYRIQTRENLGIHEDEILLVYAGKITPNKNVDLLIKGFAQIRKDNPKVKLLIIGQTDDQYEAELKNILPEDNSSQVVIWKDFVPNAELPKFFNAADIGVWPGNPSNVVQEGIACGLPVILSDHPVNRFLIQQNESKNGLITEENAEKLSLVLQKLISDSDLRQKMSQGGRKHAVEHFSWKAIAQEFLKDLDQNNIN